MNVVHLRLVAESRKKIIHIHSVLLCIILRFIFIMGQQQHVLCKIGAPSDTTLMIRFSLFCILFNNIAFQPLLLCSIIFILFPNFLQPSAYFEMILKCIYCIVLCVWMCEGRKFFIMIYHFSLLLFLCTVQNQRAPAMIFKILLMFYIISIVSSSFSVRILIFCIHSSPPTFLLLIPFHFILHLIIFSR